MRHNMKSRHTLAAALIASCALGIAGAAFAADTSPASPDTTATTPKMKGDANAPAGNTRPSTNSSQSATSPGMNAPTITPSRSELPDSAFKKLDSSSKGYVTRDDVQSLPGFDQAFQANDRDHDGRLDATEFSKAWSQYSGTQQ